MNTHPSTDLPLPDPVVGGRWGGLRLSTGLEQLDDRLDGLAYGELWVVTAAPGQGRSTLLTQLAVRLASHHAVPTWLTSNRGPDYVISGRAHSMVGRVPLNHFQNDRLTVDDRSKLEAARQSLSHAPLRFVSGAYTAHWMSDSLHLTAKTRPIATLFDDPDWEPGWELNQARSLADAGAAVVVSVPRHRVLDGNAYQCDLEPEMALADVVLEVRHSNLAAADVDPRDDQPGHAAIAVLRNRRGPIGTALVAFQGHYARFVTLLEPPDSPGVRR